MSEGFPKEVIENLLYIVNRSWFLLELLVLTKLGPEELIKILKTPEYEALAEEFGRRQSIFLKEKGFVRGEGAEAIFHALDKFSSWRLFEGERFEVLRISEREMRIRTYNCSAQRAAARRGIPHYPCRFFGLPARRGFVKGIDERAEVRCVFAPPDSRPPGIPEEVSCEYVVEL